ncbi:MAG TPA: hypothetical protein VF053_02505, partial [Streptosporangiales bacterium]
DECFTASSAAAAAELREVWDGYQADPEANASFAEPEADPLAHVKVGDPDPTPDLYCAAWSQEADVYCTCRPRHAGQHVAGDGTVVLAVWGGEAS